MSSKGIYKSLILYVKLVPMIICAIIFLNVILSYFNFEIKIFNYIVFALLITFVYLCSYALKFCNYHRMFIHYIVVTTAISTYDYYYEIPINNLELLMVYSLITIVFMFIILFLKQKKI